MTDDRIPQRFRYWGELARCWGTVYPMPGITHWRIDSHGVIGCRMSVLSQDIPKVIAELFGSAEFEWLDHDYDWSGKPAEPEPPVRLYSVAVKYERVLKIAAVSEGDALECAASWSMPGVINHSTRSETVTNVEPMPPGTLDDYADDCTGKAAAYFKNGVYSPQGETDG